MKPAPLMIPVGARSRPGKMTLGGAADPSRSSRGPGGERGVALVVVLLLIAILAALGSEIVYESRVQMILVRNYQDYLRARYVAKAGVNLAEGLLANTGGPFENTGVFQNDFINLFRCGCLGQTASPSSDLSQQQNLALQNQQSGQQSGPQSGQQSGQPGQPIQEGCGLWKLAINYPIDEDLLDLTLTDEQTRLNLNALVTPATAPDVGAGKDISPQGMALRGALKTLFLYQANRHGLQMTDVEADAILDYLVDWMDWGTFGGKFDSDQVTSFEDGDRVYSVKNGPMDTVDELRLIPGITDDLFYAVRDFVTVYPLVSELQPGIPPKFSPQVNLNLASQEVLLAMLCAAGTQPGTQQTTCNFDDALAQVQTMVQSGISAQGRLQSRTLPPGLTSSSPGFVRTYRIVASGITQSGVVATIQTVIRVTQKQKGVQIVYWSEN